MKKQGRTYMKKLTKKDRQAWWRSLTAEEQTNYRCKIMEERGVVPNWDKEYTQIIKENKYMK